MDGQHHFQTPGNLLAAAPASAAPVFVDLQHLVDRAEWRYELAQVEQFNRAEATALREFVSTSPSLAGQLEREWADTVPSEPMQLDPLMYPVDAGQPAGPWITALFIGVVFTGLFSLFAVLRMLANLRGH